MYSKEFLESLSLTKVNEGIYSNKPNDKGGETYIGISRKFNPNWAGWPIIDQYKKLPDFPGNLSKIKYLQELVDSFYYEEFWMKLRCEEINSPLIKFAVFDFGVNVGVYDCVKVVQETIGVTIDGILGNKTLFAINQFPEKLMLSNFDLEKIERYVEIVDRDNDQLEWFFGWVKRVILNRQKR